MTTFPRALALSGNLASLLLLLACNQQPTGEAARNEVATDSTQTAATAMTPASTSFGKTTDGTEVQLYTLTNSHGLQAKITETTAAPSPAC